MLLSLSTAGFCLTTLKLGQEGIAVVCLSVCSSGSDSSEYLSVCPSVCLSVCLSACLSLSLSVRLSVSLSVCLSVCLSACFSLSVSLSVCLSLCLSVHLSKHLSVCLCLSVCHVFYSNISSDHMLYSEKDLEKSMDKIETVNFHQVSSSLLRLLILCVVIYVVLLWC